LIHHHQQNIIINIIIKIIIATMSSEYVGLYVIHCMDDISCGIDGMVDNTSTNGIRFNGSAKRMMAYADHKAWQAETSNVASPHYIKKIAAGPMESDDGKYMIGSMFIVEGTRQQAEAFIDKDPFNAAQVWDKVSINRYVSIPNGIKEVKCEKDGDDITTIRMISSL